MGCFDSVNFKCPKCGGRVEAQSKAGDCSMSEFTPDEAPAKIAADIIGDFVSCDDCRERFRVAGHVHVCLRLE